MRVLTTRILSSSSRISKTIEGETGGSPEGLDEARRYTTGEIVDDYLVSFLFKLH
jgi:hypothetical protein